MKKQRLVFLISFLLQTQQTFAQSVINIIPEPQHLKEIKGVFFIQSNTIIIAQKNAKNIGEQFKNYLEPTLGYPLVIVSKADNKNTIELVLDNSLNKLGEEGYQLNVYADHILIKAFNPKGIFWATQTIRQLLPQQILRQAKVNSTTWEIPCLEIEDQPRFKWRGLMLDCSRTFIPKKQILKYLEAMSFFKMNILHLHLTDDQGWRLEIKKYPELTSICGKFDSSFHEPREYEGFYSQDDIKEIIAFAGQRNIEIIPEIEMPGHTAEVFAAFPQLSCKGDTLKVSPWVKGGNPRKEIFCAGNEATFDFIKNVLDEAAALFPSVYFHIGGDEAPKKYWKECPKCQKRIKELGLKDENELQSWFVKRIEKYLNSKGKKLTGWDEIMDGGLSKTATVMYWRNWQKDIAKKIPNIPNDIVMSPTSHCYFDYTYQTISTEKVYQFDPASKEYFGNHVNKVLGIQANFWSHLDRTEPRIDRQLFPRILALAEIAWTNNDRKDLNNFKQRLESKLESLNLMGIFF